MLLASIRLEMLRTPRLECGRLGVAVAYPARRDYEDRNNFRVFHSLCSPQRSGERLNVVTL